MFPRNMFNALSKKRAALLKAIAGEQNYGATSDTNSTRRNSQFHSFTASAPPILEPSMDEPRAAKPTKTSSTEDSSSPPLNPWRTLATVSCREPIATAPVSYRDRPIAQDRQADDQPIVEDQQVDERLGFCWTFINAYSDAAVRLRNSSFIYVFQFMFSILQISAIAMGFLFQDPCGVDEALPVYGAAVGAIGLFLTCAWMLFTHFSRRGRRVQEVKLCILLALMLFVMAVSVEVCIFFTTPTSFDDKAENICDKTFYYYALCKQIGTGGVSLLATLIYLPGSLSFFNFFAAEEEERDE